MKTFWIVSILLFLSGLGWLFAVHPYQRTALAVMEGQAYYAQGRLVRIFGDSGVPSGSWKAPRPIRQLVDGGDCLGLVFEGRDELALYSPSGEPLEVVPPPQKADGKGRWARSGDSWLFLHPARQALFLRKKDAPWELMLPPEEELLKPVDVAGYGDARGPRGAAILCEDPPLLLWYTFEGVADGELELTMRLVPSVRYYILEDATDFLKTRRANVPWRLSLETGEKGERALVVFRSDDDKYRRLAFLWKEGRDWKSQGVFLPSIPGRYRGTRPPQAVAFRGEGFLMAGRDGGLWYFKDKRLPAVKPWVEPPSVKRKEKILHQRAWGWAALLLAFFFLWLTNATRGSQVVIPGSSLRWSLSSLACPGLGQLLAGSRRWAVFWFAAFVFWAATSLFLLVTLRRGGSVTTATLFESFLALGTSWFLSVLQAFRWGFKDPRKPPL